MSCSSQRRLGSELNFLKWVLIFHNHNMTEPIPPKPLGQARFPREPVRQIEKVMQENQTNPLIAYYMIQKVLTYDEAVAYYQRHNHYLTSTQEHALRIMRYSLLTDLSAPEIELLMELDVDDFTEPTQADIQRFKAAHPGDSPYDRFMYGVEDPSPHEVHELPSVAHIQKVMAEHGTNPLIAYYMIQYHDTYEDAVERAQFEADEFFASGDYPLKEWEVKLLESVPFNGNPWRQPAPGEAERMFPDSKYPVQRFLYGCTEEEAAKHALDAKKGD